MLSPGKIRHVGVVVGDLDAAMVSFGRSLGLRWSPVQEWDVEGDGPGGPVRARVRLSWSLDGPVHTELIQGPPGSVWAADGADHLHHVCYGVDDVEEASRELAAGGLPVEVAGAGGAEGATSFVYHRAPDGVRVELLSDDRCAAIEAWLAKLAAAEAG